MGAAMSQCKLSESAMFMALWMATFSGLIFGLAAGAFLFSKLYDCGGLP
jgi:hypothetical protein